MLNKLSYRAELKRTCRELYRVGGKSANDNLVADESWEACSRVRQDHVGELLRRVDRCVPSHPRAYVRQRNCRVWRAWLVAKYREEVFGEPWRPDVSGLQRLRRRVR